MRKCQVFLLLMLISLAVAAEAEQADAVFERIKQALPQRGPGWSLVETDEADHPGDGSRQAGYVWANEAGEVRATVIWHRSLKAAKAQFRGSPKAGPSVESFGVDGVGDEAYLFPPIILNQEGPYNLRFRKGQVEILMSANTKDSILRWARCIAEAISPPRRKMPGEAAGSRR